MYLSFFFQIVTNILKNRLISPMSKLQSMLFGRYSSIFLSHKNNMNILNSHAIRLPQFLPVLNPSRGMKYKDVLTLRCEHCYFKKIEDRWYVFCTKFPRHKQGQKVDEKSKWIITHCTHGKCKF